MRALILLLALLLPMQLSWAAVASYCQAENDRVSTHLGHHEHSVPEADGHAATEKSETPGKSKAAGDDSGCSLCHFSCIKSVQLYGSGAVILPSAGSALHAGHPAHLTSHIADGPDKPNWLLAA